MNLCAYAKIPDLEHVLKANNIEVPRLRGLELMGEQEKYSDEEIKNWIDNYMLYTYEDVCRSGFSMDPSCFEYSTRTDMVMDKYLIQEKETEVFNGVDVENRRTVGIRWDRLHGKKRKAVKYVIKKRKNRVLAQAKAWNRYAGRNDVLYIHARIGAGNWDYYGGDELSKQPWFLEKVDDAYDDTYCDIYARINPIESDGDGSD